VSFEVGGDEAFENAVREAVIWMRRRNGAIPDEAFKGASFEVGGGGIHPAQAVNFDFSGGRIWAASLDDPDRAVLGRTWVTEITVGEQDARVQFGARLINVSRRSDAPFVPSLPGVVRQVVNRRPASADGLALTDCARRVQDDSDVDDLISVLDDPTRRLPVLVIADGATRPAFASADSVAGRLTGAAHVYSIGQYGWREMIRLLGTGLSVFDGAARLYRPGFHSETADPFDHPLWITRIGTAPDARADMVVARVLSTSVNATKKDDYPRFNVIRQAAAANDIAARRSTSSDADLSRLFEEENARLTEELRTVRAEFEQWVEEMDAAQSETQREIAELKTELARARAQNDSLRAALSTGQVEARRTPLSDYGDFENWARANLSTNVWISPKAIKAVEKSGEFDNPKLLGDALFMLDEFYVPMKKNSTPGAHAAYEDRLRQLGCEDQPCFKQKNDIKRFPEYGVTYQGDRYWCNDHIKYGGGMDPKRYFRIYYHWNEDDQVLLVGYLPGHLDNNLTN